MITKEEIRNRLLLSLQTIFDEHLGRYRGQKGSFYVPEVYDEDILKEVVAQYGAHWTLRYKRIGNNILERIVLGFLNEWLWGQRYEWEVEFE